MNLFKNKSIWLGALLLLVIGSATLCVIHKELAGQDITGILKKADLFWVFSSMAAMAVYAIADGINIRRCLQLAGSRISFARMMKYAFAGFFFSSITPSSSGGQPGQLYFMSRDKLQVSNSAFTLLCAMLSFQTAAVILGIAGVFFSRGEVFRLQGSFACVFPVGFALNLCIILFLACVLFSRRAAGLISRAGLWFIKKRGGNEEVKSRFLHSLKTYREAAVLMKKNRSVFCKMLLTSLAQILLYHTVTFFCARAVGCSELDWFTVIRVQSSLFISVSSLPLPGAVGVTEYGYVLFYADIIPKELLGSVMLLSRFCTFLLPLIVSGAGLILLSIQPADKSSEIS